MKRISSDATESIPISEAHARTEPSIRRSRMGATNQALIVGVLAAIAGWFMHVLSEKNERDAALPALPQRAEDSLKPQMITVAPVTLRTIVNEIDVIGTLTCFEEIPVSAMVDGTVLKLHSDVSSRINPGDVLMEIDPLEYELDVQQEQRSLQVDLAKLGLTEIPPSGWDVRETPSVAQAQARLNLAEARLNRLRKLEVENAASESDLDSAIGDFEAAKAERDNQILIANAGLANIRMKQTSLEIAQRQLRDTRLLAPHPTNVELQPDRLPSSRPLFVVADRMVGEGAYVRSGTEVLRLVVDAKLKLRASVPEKYSSKVAIGQRASISNSAETEPFVGTVSNIHPTVDPKKRTFEVEIQVENPEGRLKPGSFAKASIQVGERERAVTVPLEAIVTTAGITKLFVVDQGLAREYQVQLGMQTNTWAEVLAPGLPADSQVVTSGHQQLATGSPVEVRDSGAVESHEPADAANPRPDGAHESQP